MKNSFKLLLAAFAIVAAASCTKETAPAEEQTPEQPSQGLVPMTFNASIDATKATLEGSKVNWEETDEIAVFDGTAKQIFTVLECDGTTATFTGSVTEGATEFYAVYPASAGSALSEGSLTVEIPAEQTVASGKSVDGNALVMVAKGDEDAFAFKNVVSLVKFNVAADGITGVSLKGNNSEKIAGDATTAEDGIATCTGAAAATLSAASGTLAQGDYYLAIAPAEMTKGITVTCSTEDGGKIFKTTSTALSFQRSKGFNIKTVTDGDDIPNPIMTKQQLKNWAKWAAEYTKDDTIVIGADIDLENEAWTPVACKNSIDGGNHNISGINVSLDTRYCGLFLNLGAGATVKDLNFGTADGSSYDGTSVIESKYSGGEWGYTGIFGIVKGTLKNVANFADVKFTAASSTKNRVAGLAGAINDAGSRIIDCTNYGTVTYSGKATAANTVAGVLGLADTAPKGTAVSGCANYGRIISNQGDVNQYLGGVIGWMVGTANVVVDDCHNYGSFEISDRDTEAYVGGVVGFANSATTTIQNCTNEVDINIISNPKSEPLIKEDGSITYYNVVMAGGIAGRIAAGSIIKNCVNKKDISFDNSSKPTTIVGNALHIGGIVGAIYTTGQVIGCTNLGHIYTNRSSVIRIAGIAGTMAQGGTLSGCTNEGAIDISYTKATDKWIGAAGILGFVEKNDKGTNSIKDNVNKASGKVTVDCNCTNATVGVGGIIGYDLLGNVISGNTNHADISCKTQNTSMAGGIVGYAKTGATASSGNTNNGSVEAEGGNDKVICAGGIFGNQSVKSTNGTSTGDINTGAVASASGYAGALAGKNAGKFTNAKVAGSVNGTALTAANFSSYLCPSNTGTISGTTFYTE